MCTEYPLSDNDDWGELQLELKDFFKTDNRCGYVCVATAISFTKQTEFLKFILSYDFLRVSDKIFVHFSLQEDVCWKLVVQFYDNYKQNHWKIILQAKL